MKNLILIKHSLPEIDSVVPAKEWILSKTGRARCATLAGRLRKYSPDIFISSLEPKAIETAQITSQHLNKPLGTNEGLHEHDRSGVGFISREEFESRIWEFFRNPDRLVFGTETANEARERFTKTVDSLTNEHPNRNIAIVAHGTVITLFVEKYTSIEPFPFWQSMDMPSFAIFTLPQMKFMVVEKKAF